MGARGIFLVHLGDDAFGDDLCAHFRRAGFRCEQRTSGVLEVSHPERLVLRDEVDGYLRLWRVMHPHAGAFLTVGPQAPCGRG